MAGSWRFWEILLASGSGRERERERVRLVLTVMSRVLEGGDGLIRGGIEERSRDSGVRVPLEAGLEVCEAGGEVPSVAMDGVVVVVVADM